MKQKKCHILKRMLGMALVLMALFALVPASSYVLEVSAAEKTPVEGSGFGTLGYKDWCQRMSTYKGVRKGGCRVTAYTKLLYEAGYTQVKNPDVFFKWGVSKKYFKESSAYENVSFGKPMIEYVKAQGGTASLKKKISIKNKKKSDVADMIMGYIEDGYYCILSCSAHTVYVGREESLKAGTPVILDSSFGSSKKWKGTYGNIIKYTDYTARNMTNLRVFKVDEAKEQAIAKSYKITLDNQGGGSKSYIYEGYGVGYFSDSKCKKAITKVSVPTKKGYVFQGYYTAKNGKGKKYINASGKITAGQQTFKKNTTLYAHWKSAPVYKITLNRQNGSANQYIYEKYLTGFYSNNKCTKALKKVTVPKKSGYTFMGYYTAKNGKGTQCINSSGKVVADANVFKKNTTIYAYWKEKNPVYKITLDPKNSGTKQYIYMKYGVGLFSDSACTKAITSVKVPVKDGYTFMGYYTNEGGLGSKKILASGEVAIHKTSLTQNLNLYAYWEKSAEVYKITLKPQNGGADQYIYEKFGVGFYSDSACTKKITSIAVPTKQDWIFNGYWTENTDAGFRYVNASGQILADNTAIKGDIVLYGLWTKNTNVYKITLDSQTGSGSTSEMYVKYDVWFCRYSNGTSQIEKLRPTTRDGYTYGGYYTGKNGTGTQCVDKNGNFVVSTKAFTQDTTWYCYWIPN